MTIPGRRPSDGVPFLFDGRPRRSEFAPQREQPFAGHLLRVAGPAAPTTRRTRGSDSSVSSAPTGPAIAARLPVLRDASRDLAIRDDIPEWISPAPALGIGRGSGAALDTMGVMGWRNLLQDRAEP
jgi:hypothetical protein